MSASPPVAVMAEAYHHDPPDENTLTQLPGSSCDGIDAVWYEEYIPK
jgi:hypothetical protein